MSRVAASGLNVFKYGPNGTTSLCPYIN